MIFINGYGCGPVAIYCCIFQGSVLGALLLFLLYMNNINQAIKLCKFHQSADHTNLLCLSNSKRQWSLKTSSYWLNENKISLTVKITEMVIFNSKGKKFESDLRIKLFRQKTIHIRDLSKQF